MKAYAAILLVATALACDVGRGVDRAILLAAHSDAVGPGVSRNHDEVLAELGTKLGLSADQSARVREILARHHAESEAAPANHQRTMQELMTEIQAVLDSTQIQRLHAWFAERHDPASRHPTGHGH